MSSNPVCRTTPTDLIVAGWSAEFVYDLPSGAASIREILEHANVQMLELRHYDES